MNLDEDVTNGGCESNTVVYGDASCDITICGTISTYDIDTTGDMIPDTDARDTDWYLITQAELMAADLDANGVVQLRATLSSEFSGTTFFVTFEPDCSSLGFPGSIGSSDRSCAGGSSAVFTLVVADHPNGVAAFVSSADSDGPIFDGFECSTGLNDYTLLIECVEPPTNCNVTDQDLLPCYLANPGVGGCEDPECCALVCLPEADGGFNPLCCEDIPLGWIQPCADAAIDLGCSTEGLGAPICIATGPDPSADGYLEVCPDAYGAWTAVSFGGAGDRFNPVPGALGLQEISMTGGFFIFVPSTLQRELLATSPEWQAVTELNDSSLDRKHGVNTEFDDNGDGVSDRLTSTFFAIGGNILLRFNIEQKVEQITVGDVTSAVLTQTCLITSGGESSVEFDLIRVLDGNLAWVGDISDDAVGKEGIDVNSVFMREAGSPATQITMSSPDATAYFGAKTGIDPDGNGPGPAMGLGTDVQVWDAYGIPEGWRNFVAGVGYDTEGESGPTPAGCTDPCDAFIGLEIAVSMGPLSSTTIEIQHTYGSACPWDCDGSFDGNVNVGDLLALLGQYDVGAPGNCTGGSCDFNGDGCVDVVDLLKLLSHYTTDPDGIGCPQ